MIGIYGIYNTKTGDIYIGSSRNIQQRWAQHRSCLKRNKSTPHLQHAWNKYGGASFEFVVLEECGIDDLIAREQFWYDHLNASYNCGRPKPGSPEISAETREKISRALTGRKMPRSPEHQKKLNVARIGRKASEETRRKMSQMRRGAKRKPHSVETRRKISASNLGRYVPSRPCRPETRDKIRMRLMGNKNSLGTVLSTETRAKISAVQKGRPKSAEHRQKISEIRRGKPISAETREKISAALKGRKKSPEAIAKFSAARMGHPVSQETRAKLSAAKKGVKVIGRKMSLEARMKLSQAQKGRPSPNRGKKMSAEACAKMRVSHLGKSIPPETREKMRASAIEAWKRRKEQAVANQSPNAEE